MLTLITVLALSHCPDDGRLKGVRVGTTQFYDIVEALPDHQCIVAGPNGIFLVTPRAIFKL